MNIDIDRDECFYIVEREYYKNGDRKTYAYIGRTDFGFEFAGLYALLPNQIEYMTLREALALLERITRSETPSLHRYGNRVHSLSWDIRINPNLIRKEKREIESNEE